MQQYTTVLTSTVLQSTTSTITLLLFRSRILWPGTSLFNRRRLACTQLLVLHRILHQIVRYLTPLRRQLWPRQLLALRLPFDPPSRRHQLQCEHLNGDAISDQYSASVRRQFIIRSFSRFR